MKKALLISSLTLLFVTALSSCGDNPPVVTPSCLGRTVVVVIKNTDGDVLETKTMPIDDTLPITMHAGDEEK